MTINEIRKKQAAFANQSDPDRVNGCVVPATAAVDDEAREMIAKYDELSEAWNDANDQLASSRFPFAVWIETDGTFGLGWDRYAGKWRIMVADLSGERGRPVNDANMTMRVTAATYFGDLKRALEAKRNELHPKVTDAIKRIRDQLTKPTHDAAT